LTDFAIGAFVMGITSMNVSLPEELKEFAEAQTKGGRQGQTGCDA
jgi:hypothetical protein